MTDDAQLASNDALTPSRWRKKPIVIEAVRLSSVGHAQAIAKWIVQNGGNAMPKFLGTESIFDGLLIWTIEGTMKADLGDWIIRGVKGEFYPCKNDVFEATYEPAD